MASQTYINQSNQLNNSLNTWAGFISLISQIISQFNTNVQYVQEQIDNINLTLESVEEKVNKLIQDNSTLIINKYIKVSSPIINIGNSINKKNTVHVGISTNVPTVYVFSNRTVPGLTFAGVDVSKGCMYSFSGAETGCKFVMEASNVLKTGDIILTFCSSSNIDEDDESLIKETAVVKLSDIYEFKPVQIPASLLNTPGQFSTAISTINAANNVPSNATIAESIEKFKNIK